MATCMKLGLFDCRCQTEDVDSLGEHEGEISVEEVRALLLEMEADGEIERAGMKDGKVLWRVVKWKN